MLVLFLRVYRHGPLHAYLPISLASGRETGTWCGTANTTP